MKSQLGYTYRDKITGYEGVCMGRIEYLTGCNQAALSSRSLDKEGKPQDMVWFDEQRLDLQQQHSRIVLDNGTSPGADFPPPNPSAHLPR